MANNNALINAYRKGFQEGRKHGDRVVDLDYKILVAAVTVALDHEGMDSDTIIEVIEYANKWLADRKGRTPDELFEEAGETTGIELKQVEAEPR